MTFNPKHVKTLYQSEYLNKTLRCASTLWCAGAIRGHGRYLYTLTFTEDGLVVRVNT